eukprot:9488437-Pyramimonas_sp.AAC.1
MQMVSWRRSGAFRPRGECADARAQKDTSHSPAMRPRMRCPAMAHQLEPFFRSPSARRERSQMDQPFAAVFGGAPAVD